MTEPEASVKVSIDWEHQAAETVTVSYNDSAGRTSGKLTFARDPGIKEGASEHDVEIAHLQNMVFEDLAGVLDTLRAVSIAEDVQEGERPTLFRAIITEGTVKAPAMADIVDLPVFTVEALWGEPGNPIRHHLGGQDLQDLLASVVDSARLLIEAFLEETHVGIEEAP